MFRDKLKLQPLHDSVHCFGWPPIAPHFIISHGKWLFYNVIELSSMRQPWISSHSTSAANIFALYLFEQRSVQFHWLFPSGYFSRAAQRWGINNTCPSLKFTFIKRASTTTSWAWRGRRRARCDTFTRGRRGRGHVTEWTESAATAAASAPRGLKRTWGVCSRFLKGLRNGSAACLI